MRRGVIGCSAGCVKVGRELEEGRRRERQLHAYHGAAQPKRQESERFRRRKGRTILSNTPSVVATAKEEGLSLRISSRHRSRNKGERGKMFFFGVFLKINKFGSSVRREKGKMCVLFWARSRG